MDWFTVYLTCFLIGLGVVSLLAILGQFGGDHGGGHDVGAGGGHDVHVGDMHDGVQGAHLPLFSPNVLSVFVGMFGAGGLIMLKGFGVTTPAIHLAGAAASSLGSGFGTAYLMMRIMRAVESNSIGSHTQLVGRTVEVVVSIKDKEFGEIAFESGGTRQTLVARTHTGKTFSQGDAVQVVQVVEGVAYVAPVGTIQPISQVSSGHEGTPVAPIKNSSK